MLVSPKLMAQLCSLQRRLDGRMVQKVEGKEIVTLVRMNKHRARLKDGKNIMKPWNSTQRLSMIL